MIHLQIRYRSGLSAATGSAGFVRWTAAGGGSSADHDPEYSACATHSRLDSDGFRLAVHGAGPTLNAGILVHDLHKITIAGQYIVRAYFQTESASGAFVSIQLKADNIAQVDHQYPLMSQTGQQLS